MEKAVIRCTLVTSDDEHTPHAHRLIRRTGSLDIDDPHDIEVSSTNEFTAEYVCPFCLTWQTQIDLFISVLYAYMFLLQIP